MGQSPRFVALGDFDGNGIQDVAATTTSGLVLSLGKEGGGFFPPKSVLVSFLQLFLTVEDLDGDGRDDLVLGTDWDRISVLRQFNGFSFVVQNNYQVGTKPIGAVFGDFNEDGIVDMAVANEDSDDVSILKGFGGGLFLPQNRFPIGLEPNSITTADFDVDGNLDLAVANDSLDRVTVIFGEGDGTFDSPSSFTTGDSPHSISGGDFDEDGFPDLIVAIPSFSGQLNLLRGMGGGAFGSPEDISFSPGKRPRTIVVGDINVDGHQDVAGISNFWNSVSVVYGNGDGSFLPEVEYHAGRSPRDLVMGDIDGAPGLDFAVANFDGDNISLLLNNGDGTFPQEVQWGAGDPSFIIQGDFNNDGKEDLAASRRDVPTVSVQLGKGNGTQFSGRSVTIDDPGPLAAGDFDGDGNQDLAVTKFFYEIPGRISIYYGTGFGTFTRNLILEVPDFPRRIVAEDFNGDGMDDIAVSIGTGGFPLSGVSIFLGKADGSFGPETRFPAGYLPYLLDVGDFDENGVPDLVVTNFDTAFGTPQISVLLGLGDGTFATAQTIPLTDSTRALEVGDFDNDFHLDFAVIDPEPPKILIYRGLGNGTFLSFPVATITPWEIDSLAAGDFNLDGNLDLVSFYWERFGFEGLSFWPGQGNGSFDSEIRFQVGYEPGGLLSRDLNGDDRPDVIFGNEYFGISILINSPPMTDTDRDDFPDVEDNCPDIFNPDQGDFDLDGVGDPCDICPSDSNPLQVDFDGDRIGDICDSCPFDFFNDLDRDGLCADVDPCPDHPENDQDGDGICEDVDNCPSAHNPDQEDSNGDGAGDACQPFVSILDIAPVSEDSILARVRFADPQGDDIRVTVVLSSQNEPIVLGNFFPDKDCSETLSLGLGGGVVLAYIPVNDFRWLVDPSITGARCPGDNSRAVFAFGSCENSEGGFVNSFIDLASKETPLDICVRTESTPFEETTITVQEFDHAQITIENPTLNKEFVLSFFDSRLPEINLDSLPLGEKAFLTLGVTDFRNPPVEDTKPFAYNGETSLVFQFDGVNFSEGDPEIDFQCNSIDGSTVILDASGLAPGVDPRTPLPDGFLFEWFEDFGTLDEFFLGDGVLLPVILDLGLHEITLRMTDESGNVLTEIRAITVLDTLGPELNIPPDSNVECTSVAGTPVNLGTATAIDACFGPIPVTVDQPGPFPLGTTELTWAAEDPLGNASIGVQLIQVQDSLPPVLTIPEEIMAECIGPNGTSVDLGTPIVSDNCSEEITVFHNAPTLFPLGITDVTWTTEDTFNNIATIIQSVTVSDTKPPELTVIIDPALLWPPNHRLIDFEAGVSVIEECGDASIILESVTSNEDDDAEGSGDGKTVNDIRGVATGVFDTEFQLRAERSGDGSGRIYSVTYFSVDDQGNSIRTVADVFIPHDLGGVTEPLMLTAWDTDIGTELSWTAVAEAQVYNVIRGRMDDIREHQDYYHLGNVDCVGSGLLNPTTVVLEDSEFPAIGEAYFYLVEYDDGQRSGFGTVTAAKERFVPPGQGKCP
jgi:hypothetical protein